MLQQEIDSLVPSRDLTRRAFVGTAVGSGFAAAVLPVTAQTITTDTQGLTAGPVTVSDTLDKMREALQAAGNTRSEFEVSPETPHAFHADYRPSYRKEQADDGWKRAVAWFKANGVA